jgi:serine/threonine-protein kinase
MSPERAQGGPSAWSDLYSLGVVLYEMLTGELPTAPRSGRPCYEHVNEPPRSPREANSEFRRYSTSSR